MFMASRLRLFILYNVSMLQYPDSSASFSPRCLACHRSLVSRWKATSLPLASFHHAMISSRERRFIKFVVSIYYCTLIYSAAKIDNFRISSKSFGGKMEKISPKPGDSGIFVLECQRGAAIKICAISCSTGSCNYTYAS